MNSVEAENVGLLFEEVAKYEGTFEDAVTAMIIPEPKMMPFTEWASWRKKKGLRPTKRQGCDRLMTYLEELKLWNRVMVYYHGDEWKWIMDTWVVSETENMEAYLKSVKEDERVFEYQAPSETAEPKRFTLDTSTGGEPLGFAPAASNIGVGLHALSKSTSSESLSS